MQRMCVNNSVSTNSAPVVHDGTCIPFVLFYQVSFVPRERGPGDKATTKSDCKHSIYLEVRDSCVGSVTHRVACAEV